MELPNLFVCQGRVIREVANPVVRKIRGSFLFFEPREQCGGFALGLAVFWQRSQRDGADLV